MQQRKVVIDLLVRGFSGIVCDKIDSHVDGVDVAIDCRFDGGVVAVD
jgi:hypothetical protein